MYAEWGVLRESESVFASTGCTGGGGRLTLDRYGALTIPSAVRSREIGNAITHFNLP